MKRMLIGTGLVLLIFFCALPPMAVGAAEMAVGAAESVDGDSYSVPDLLLKTIADADLNIIIACGDGAGRVPAHCAVLAAQYPVREAVRSIALAGGLQLIDKGHITVIASRNGVANLNTPLEDVEFQHENEDLLTIIHDLTRAFGRMGMDFTATLRDETVVFSVSESGRSHLDRYIKLSKEEPVGTSVINRVFPPADEFISIKSVRTGLSHAVRLLLRQAGINFVSTVPLAGEVIVNLDNVHHMRALRLLLRAHGLDYRPIPNGILVEPLATESY